MLLLVLGLVLFFGAHCVSIINEPWRDRMVERLGEPTWKIAYSLLSLAGLVLVVKGYAATRLDPVFLYTPPPWMRHLSMLLLVPVFPLFVASSFPGRIKSAAKHPTLLATKIWALAHLLVNGMLADVLLFGSFLAWAVADRISMKRRTQRPLPSAPPSKANDVIVIVVGLAIYLAFVFWLHQWLFGVAIVA